MTILYFFVKLVRIAVLMNGADPLFYLMIT
jgi:hypothetical protein